MCFRPKKSQDEQQQEIKNSEIEKLLKQDLKVEEKNVKILILGTGDSGKTTFTKQLTCLHGVLSKETLESYSFILKDLALRGAQTLINCAEETGVLPKEHTEKAKSILEAQVLTPQIATDIQTVTTDPVLVQLLDTKGESLQMQGGVSGCKYYWSNSDRYAADNFTPTQEDMLRARIKTTGIRELRFTIKEIEFTIVDVGGQRSERRKWIHCFDNVTSIIYLAALDEFDMKLEEDNRTNRLEESLQLFGEVSGSQFFAEKEISWILFLNKFDLLKEKIKHRPISMFFKEYPADKAQDFDASVAFIKDKYEKKYRGGTALYPYTTCAIDTQNCEKVFSAVRDTVLTGALEEAGF